MSFALTFSLTDLKDLNTFLQSRSYVVGFTPSSTDVALFDALAKGPDASKFPNVARFYNHIASFSADQRKKFGASIGGAAAGGPVKAAAKPAADDEDVDLFGDDGDAAANAVKVEKKVEEAPKKKEKKPVVQKTICVYDVKPGQAETDPKDLEAAIRSITMDGLQWGETFKVEEIAYGIKKLVVQFVCEDEKVSLDELEELMMSFKIPGAPEDDNDLIGSVDQLSMNKIT